MKYDWSTSIMALREMAKKRSKPPQKGQPSNTPKKTEKDDYDSPWKDFIERYFRDFLQFFFPDIEADIDWDRPIRFLDKELQKVVRDAEIPRRYADKLVQVYRRNGEAALVICHIEVQGEKEDDFEERMFSYNYRLGDRYKCPVVSLAIIADTNKEWRPTRLNKSLWGCSTQFEFPIVKLLDYQDKWAELEASQNPFAVVVMAHLKTKETHDRPTERKEWKFHLMTMLYDRGYGEQDILELHHFLDWLMRLPKELEQQFQAEFKAFEEAKQMRYVTSIERMAKEQQKQEIALNLLQQGLAIAAIAQATGLTIEEIQALQVQQN
jgi:hypothetical protein